MIDNTQACRHGMIQRLDLFVTSFYKILLIIVILLWHCCIVACTVTPALAAPASWERLIDGVYENKGVAKIELVAKRYVLTVYCHGVHSVYIHSAEQVNLSDYLRQFVQARYTYIDRIYANVQCVRAPCPPIVERGLQLQTLRVVSSPSVELSDYITTCGGTP